MLFPYTYIKHRVETYQEFVRFLVHEVWANADGPFSAELLMNGQDDSLYKFYLDNDHKTSGRAYEFNLCIEQIYKYCEELRKAGSPILNRFVAGYDINNNIARLCADKTLQPLTYDELKGLHADLGHALQRFCSSLYGGGSPFNTVHFDEFDRKHTADHYRQFMIVNNKRLCPFCGIHRIKGQFDGPRDAYDHYFPKSVYPFNSINFHNLVPMCDECNESYKKTREPIFSKKTDRANSRCKAYYPFDLALTMPKFSVSVGHKDYETLTHNDVELTVEKDGCHEEVDSWLRLFNLDHRYRLLLTEESFGKDWIEDIFEAQLHDERILIDGELCGENLTGLQYCEKEIRLSRRNAWAQQKFLKGPLLQAYRDIGLFNALT